MGLRGAIGVERNSFFPSLAQFTLKTPFRNQRFMLDEMLQNLPYTYFFIFQSLYFFSLMNALVYVDIDQDIH